MQQPFHHLGWHPARVRRLLTHVRTVDFCAIFLAKERSMRALCGAIITAGALIGLGLTAIGLGQRYQSFPYHDVEGKGFVLFKNLDTSLMAILIALLASLGVGMGVAFVGLAYHHHRRHHEWLRDKERLSKETSPV
jgi:hypothetical protein